VRECQGGQNSHWKDIKALCNSNVGFEGLADGDNENKIPFEVPKGFNSFNCESKGPNATNFKALVVKLSRVKGHLKAI